MPKPTQSSRVAVVKRKLPQGKAGLVEYHLSKPNSVYPCNKNLTCELNKTMTFSNVNN